MNRKIEISHTRRYIAKTMEFLMHNTIPGFSEDEITRTIRNLAKIEDVLESKERIIEWAEINVINKGN